MGDVRLQRHIRITTDVAKSACRHMLADEFRPDAVIFVGLGGSCPEVKVFRRNFQTAKMIGVEPRPDGLDEAAQDILVINAAIAGRTGEADFHVTHNRLKSSLSKPQGRPYQRISVPTMTLPDLIEHLTLQDDRIALWIDCEGCELDAIAALGDYFENIFWIVVEMHGTDEELKPLLSSREYEIIESFGMSTYIYKRSSVQHGERMGISRRNGCLDLLKEAMVLCGKPMPQLRIAELGNQIANRTNYEPRDSSEKWMPRGLHHKWLCEWFGATSVSFDVNGRHAARVDLSRKFTKVRQGWLYSFDIVTNFGTIEHIRNSQYWPFVHMHELCRPGGLLVHHAPKRDSWKDHGYWKFDADWFRWLAEEMGYDVLKIDEVDLHRQFPESYPREATSLLVIFRTGPRERSFLSIEQWRDPVREGRGTSIDRKRDQQLYRRAQAGGN